jgi:hypothetical protein
MPRAIVQFDYAPNSPGLYEFHELAHQMSEDDLLRPTSQHEDMKVERGRLLPMASPSRMDLGMAPAKREGFSDNVPECKVSCGFLILCLDRVYPARVSQGKQEREPSECSVSADRAIQCSPCGEPTGSGGDKPGSSPRLPPSNPKSAMGGFRSFADTRANG